MNEINNNNSFSLCEFPKQFAQNLLKNIKKAYASFSSIASTFAALISNPCDSFCSLRNRNIEKYNSTKNDNQSEQEITIENDNQGKQEITIENDNQGKQEIIKQNQIYKKIKTIVCEELKILQVEKKAQLTEEECIQNNLKEAFELHRKNLTNTVSHLNKKNKTLETKIEQKQKAVNDKDIDNTLMDIKDFDNYINTFSEKCTQFIKLIPDATVAYSNEIKENLNSYKKTIDSFDLEAQRKQITTFNQAIKAKEANIVMDTHRAIEQTLSDVIQAMDWIMMHYPPARGNEDLNEERQGALDQRDEFTNIYPISEFDELDKVLKEQNHIKKQIEGKQKDLNLIMDEQTFFDSTPKPAPIQLSYSVATAKTKGEDAHVYYAMGSKEGKEEEENEEYVFAGVFDGHGSDKVSNYLANNYAKTLQKQLDKNPNSVITAFENTHQELQKNIQDSTVLSGGSTAVTSRICTKNGEICTATLGDSEVILLRQDQQGQWKWIPLSNVHDWGTPKEQKKLIQLHALNKTIQENIQDDEEIKEICQKLATRYQRTDHKNLRSNGYDTLAYDRGGLNLSHSFEQNQRYTKLHNHTLISQKPIVTKAQLQKGDVVLRVSDGAIDYGAIHQFIKVVEDYSSKDKATLADRILSTIEKAQDDVTIQAFTVE